MSTENHDDNDDNDEAMLARKSRVWNRLAPAGGRWQRWMAPGVAVGLLLVVGVALASTRSGRGWSLGIDGGKRTTVEGSTGRPANATGPNDPMGPTLTLDEFLIQLKPREAERYARFALAVELTDDDAYDAAVKRMARIRAAVLETITDFSPEDLHGSDGVNRLKRQIQERIRRMLGDGVKAVYLVKFGVV